MKRLLPIASAAALTVLISAAAHSANLTEIYDQAVQNDPRLRAALATRKATEQSKPLAESALKPLVSAFATADGVAQRIDSPSMGITRQGFVRGTAGVEASMPLYRKDRVLAVSQAEEQVAKAGSDYAQAEQDLVLRVAQAYFGVLAARDTLSFAESERKAIARQLDQAKQRFEVGLIAITGVHEAQAAYDRSLADEIQARNGVDNAVESLREIIGSSPGALSQVIDKLPLRNPNPADVDRWSTMAQENNPRIRSAIRDVEIARQQVEIAKSGLSPTLDLVGDVTVTASGASGVAETQGAAVGLRLAVPLYTGGAVSASTTQAQHQLTATKENLDSIRRQVDREVRDAYRALITAISRAKALQAATVSAKSAFEATQAGFDVGTRTLVDVLNGQRDLFRARRDFAQARYDYLVSRLQLKQAAGLIARADVAKVNGLLK